MKRLLLSLAVLLPLSLAAQQPVILHSHNDYTRTAPFWEAYSQHCRSIEADVFLHEGELLVGHEVEDLKQIIAGVRNVRASKNIPQKEVLTLISPVALNPLVAKLANVKVAVNGEVSGNASKFIVGTTEFAIPMDQFINVDEELKKLEADLAHQQGFLKGVMAKLGNERFVANAKPEIVELERKKKADAESRIAAIEAAIKALKG